MNRTIIEKINREGCPTVNIRYADGEPGKYPICFGPAYAKLLLQALKEQPDFLEKFVEEIPL